MEFYRFISLRKTVLSALLLLASTGLIRSSQLIFNLEAHDELCFHETIQKGDKAILEYQVIDGGNLDCSVTLKSPSEKVLYDKQQQQYDSHTWTADEEGVYSWCFSNKFSTFTSKKIFFDFASGEKADNVRVNSNAVDTAMTSLEVSLMGIHESLNVIEDYQKHFRLREMTGRAFADEISDRVTIWSVIEFVFIIVIMVSQVFTVQSFFSEKKNKLKMPS